MISVAFVTKMWISLDGVSDPQFAWSLDLADQLGRSMPFGRFTELARLDDAVEKLRHTQSEPFPALQVHGHFSLARAPECLDEAAIAANAELEERIAQWNGGHES